MFGMKIIGALMYRITTFNLSRDKPNWSRQSPIDLLADSLSKDPDGWVIDHNAIRRNGVIIAWSGRLNSGVTVAEVRMDGKRFPVSAAEGRNLKEAVAELIARRLA